MIRLTPMAHTEAKTITVDITGASGAIYAQVLLRALDRDAHVSMPPGAQRRQDPPGARLLVRHFPKSSWTN